MTKCRCNIETRELIFLSLSYYFYYSVLKTNLVSLLWYTLPREQQLQNMKKTPCEKPPRKLSFEEKTLYWYHLSWQSPTEITKLVPFTKINSWQISIDKVDFGLLFFDTLLFWILFQCFLWSAQKIGSNDL